MFGCSNAYKEEVLKKSIISDLNISKTMNTQRKAFEIIEVDAEHFDVAKEIIPDMETVEQVKILGAQLDDVIALLTEATGQDIIFQLQSENFDDSYANNKNNTNNVNNNVDNIDNYENSNNDERQIRESKVYLSASNIGFGRLLKKAVGNKLSIRYDEKTYYIGHVKTVTLKIPSLVGLPAVMEKTLETLGALNVVHDPITSSVTFSAREREYQDIMEYLTILRNNLYVIEYQISIYDVELKDDYSLGINWNLMPAIGETSGIISKTSSAFGSVVATTPAATFGTLIDSDIFSGNIMAEALAHFGKVESIQKPKLLGVAGTDVVLVDGVQEPYIKELKTTAVGESGIQTSTVSGTALSGLKVTLNSNIMDGTVLTDISLEISDIVGYSNFDVDGVSYSQPKTRTKNIKNSMRVQPGVAIVISGLFRNKLNAGYKGIPGISQTSARLFGGSEYESNIKTEMVIIVTPRVIKYVMK